MYDAYTVTLTVTVTAADEAGALTAVGEAVGAFNYLAIHGAAKAELAPTGSGRSARRIQLEEVSKVKRAK